MLKNAERHRSELKKMPKLEPLEMHKNVPKGKLMKERFGRLSRGRPKLGKLNRGRRRNRLKIGKGKQWNGLKKMLWRELRKMQGTRLIEIFKKELNGSVKNRNHCRIWKMLDFLKPKN